MSESNWPELEVDVYTATPKFRAIDRHVCVCTAEDGGLVAVVGPEGDPKSERYGRLFAAAPNTLETIQRVARTVHDAFHVGAAFETCTENTCDAVRKAVAKARGES